MIYDVLKVLFAFALLGFVTWLWGQVSSYVAKNYLAPVITTELAVQKPLMSM